MRIYKVAMLATLALILNACSSGDGSSNPSPTVSAGSNQSVDEGVSVTLTGNASDSNGSINAYAWTQISGETVTLSAASSASTTFTAPATNSNVALEFRLTVTDDEGATASDTVTVTVNTTNQSPTANAGADQSADEASTVTLNGSGSSDSDGSIASYDWQQVSGPTASINNNSSATASLTAPGVSEPTQVVIRLTVTDDRDATASDDVTITVNPVAGLNQAPSANAGADQTANGASTVTLDGSASSDSDGSISNYLWAQTSGTTVTLSSATAAMPSFTAPDVGANETVSFSLTVTDNEGLSANDSVSIIVQPQPVGTTVSGKLTFDQVPHNTTTSGLNYAAITQAPIRGATVQLLQGSNIVDTTVSNASGDYSFDAENNTSYTVRVRAELLQNSTQSWNVRVIDNTSSNALYALDSASFDTGDNATLTMDLNAASGWGGSSYTSTRAAAPFNILDRIYIIIDKLKAVDADLTLTELNINWSPNNVPQSGDRSQGQIGTSFYSRGQIFLLGAANTDSDEYDGHVIIHEWGHYFEDNNARSDSVGGPHGGGDRLDMRVAFGEGFANAWSGIITDDSFYRDSFGSSQANGFSKNVENNSVSNPGWFNEGSVQSILYDVYDNANDDSAALGLQPIYDTLTGKQRNGEAFTSIFSFITYLKEDNIADSASINSLLSGQNIQTNTDIWGSTETDDEGQAAVLPVYTVFNPGDSKQLCTITVFGNDGNKLGNRKFLRLNVPGNGNYTVRLTPSGAHDLDIFVFQNGEFVAITQAGGTGVDEVTADLNTGTYVADVQSYNAAGQDHVAACFDVDFIPN